MKKIVSILVLTALLLCGCQSKGDRIDRFSQTDTAEVEDLSFTSGVNITNNDIYDASGRREFNFNTLLGSFDGIEVYSEGNQTFIANIEGNIIITLLFKNVSDKALGFGLNAECELDGSYMQYVIKEDVETLVHPNGCNSYILEPGEEKTAEIDLTLPHGRIDNDIRESLIISNKVTVMDTTDASEETFDFSVEETIEFLSSDTLLSDEYKNAVVTGTVTDENGNPLSGIEVEVACPFLELWNKVETDENGQYSITVIGAKSTYSGAWREYALIVEDPAYSTRYIPVYPKSNQTITADITMYASESEYVYEEVNTVDLGLQAYEYDTDQSTTIAFVPFHTGYNSEDVADLIKLTVTDYDGNVLYTHQLPEEIPYIDLSADAKYTTVVENGNNGGFTAVILDEAGNTVYSTHDLKQPDSKYGPAEDNVANTISRVSQLSNDNKYLVVGDIDGNIWFIDWQNDEVCWSDWQMGQIRNIKFEDDNTFYVSTGGGDLLCYDFSGNIKWVADTQSWATKMEVTDKYVVVTTKCCGKSLLAIDKTSGEIVWDYPTLQTSMSLSISPDEKYVWFGGHSSSSFSKIGCSVFNLDSGELVGMISTMNFDGGQFSGDGSIIVTRDDNNIYVNNAKSGQLLFKKEISYDGSTTLNMAVAVNEDGSKFVVTMNDRGDGYYGTAHYFALQEKKTANESSDADSPGAYRIEGNDITFERNTEYSGFEVYDNVIINKDVTVSLTFGDETDTVNGFIINDCLTIDEGASLIITGEGALSPRLEFNDGATAIGIDLYSESGDLLNGNSEFINDSGLTLAFVWKDGKWMIEI